MYEDFRDHNEVFDGMFCRYAFPVQIGGAQRRRRRARPNALRRMVSGTYFPVLGVRPALGRLFGPEDDRAPGAAPYAVLSHGYWSSRFNRDPNILGKRLTINNQPLTIIGVAEEGFSGMDVGETHPGVRPGRDERASWRRAIWCGTSTAGARAGSTCSAGSKPGITAEQAEQRLQPFYRSIIEEEVKEKAFARASAYTKSEFLRSRMTVMSGAQGWSYRASTLTKPLWVLMALVGGVLLIACANVANLQVARGAARQREIAIRLALGAGRWRIIQQLLVESLVIALAGGVARSADRHRLDRAAALAAGACRTAHQVSTAIDLRIAGAAFAATVVTGILFGLVPALQATRPQLAPTLKDESGSVAGSSAAVRLRKALVVVQVSLSLLLLIGAGLFVRSINHLMTVDLGFRTSRLVSFSLDPWLNGYDEARLRELFRALRARLRGDARRRTGRPSRASRCSATAAGISG